MKIEDVPITVGDSTRYGVIRRVTCTCGEVAFLHRDSQEFLTFEEMLLDQIKVAKWRYGSFYRNCPGRKIAAADVAFWEQTLKEYRANKGA